MNTKEISDILKEKNLEYTNSISPPVHPKHSFYLSYGKRIIDILLSLPAFIILIPINCILAILTFFDVGTPILFRQKRSGRNGKPFTMIKFRNMTNKVDENGELLPPSQRVTKLGSFIRKMSLDELLNFWSVLKGDMSIIGPRPLPVTFYEYFSERHKQRYSVKPGIECPLLHPNGSLRHYDEQLENDIWYVENVSLWIDIKLMFCLLRMVFDKKMRTYHAQVDGGDFVGYDSSGRAVNKRTAIEKNLMGIPEQSEGKNDYTEILTK